MSPRSLQRALATEGTSFRLLLDEARRDSALAAVPGSVAPLALVAGSLGYGEQSSLSRAMRRWKGRTPSDLRARASGHPPDEPL